MHWDDFGLLCLNQSSVTQGVCWNFRFGGGGVALAPSSAGRFFLELLSLPFFFFTIIEKSSYIHYGILRKTKEFASETAWHIVIVVVEIRLPMGYSPRWKKKFKKLKLKIIKKLTKPTSTFG